MNVASLELSKELFELSGWDDTDYVWLITENATVLFQRINANDMGYPAYDLGFLLRKLPPKVNTGDNPDYRGDLLVLKPFWPAGREPDKWEASYCVGYFFIADTPEDAVAKLATELFKQGILKKEAL